jgi:hypothetical protein
VLSIMDGFVREIEADEVELSWHPKIALARYTNEDHKSTEWRLWIGSKNLTRDPSWDTGLLLSGVRETSTCSALVAIAGIRQGHRRRRKWWSSAHF